MCASIQMNSRRATFVASTNHARRDGYVPSASTPLLKISSRGCEVVRAVRFQGTVLPNDGARRLDRRRRRHRRRQVNGQIVDDTAVGRHHARALHVHEELRGADRDALVDLLKARVGDAEIVSCRRVDALELRAIGQAERRSVQIHEAERTLLRRHRRLQRQLDAVAAARERDEPSLRHAADQEPLPGRREAFNRAGCVLRSSC